MADRCIQIVRTTPGPGDGEVTVVTDETLGENDPLLAKLLAAATAGAPPAGPATKRKPVRIVLDPTAEPQAKGRLCATSHGFNLQAATRVVANDKPGRERLCRYILRPPLANDRLSILNDGNRVVPTPAAPAADQGEEKRINGRPRYIRWAELLQRVFGFEVLCTKCQSPLRLIDLIKDEAIAKKILTAMHLPAEAPELHPARPPPARVREAREAEDWMN